jgi:NitT/TauT family transport system substrate-binding protein
MRFITTSIKAALAVSLFTANLATAAEKDSFKIAWSIYAGWMPWDYAASSGIMKKWADKYGIKVDIVQVNDYVESINQYTAGSFDGCVMTNMDALTIPSAGGVNSTALIVGDFSNGNDGIVIKGKDKKVGDLKNQKINLVELSVSHYLLARALAKNGLSEKDVKVINTADADIVATFASRDTTATVTWNPLLSSILATPDTTKVFDSSEIPGEIIDLMVVNNDTLKDNPKLGKALTGAWYEIMDLMSKGDETALTAMAKAAGTDLADYKKQLTSTKMFYAAKDAVSFTASVELPKTMQSVSEFSFAHGLLGNAAKDAKAIGMSFPNNVTYGDQGNLKLRFDTSYMQMAADSKL